MDIFRHREIIKKLPDVIILMDEPVKEILNKVLKESQDAVNNYNWSNQTIIDATKTELGTFKSCCKKVLYAHYKNEKMPIDIDDVEFSSYLINSKILLNRNCNFYKMTPLQKVLNQNIKLEIIKEYESFVKLKSI